MIAKLTGEIIEVEPTFVVLDVNGVGYLVGTISSVGYEAGQQCSFYTYLAVRENALDLYGFKSREELKMFNALIKIPKIGPKTAIQILSQADLQTLKKAIYNEDPVYLTKMSGIGKKSAEKIVTELKGSFDTEMFTDAEKETNNADADVVDALIALGYSQRDALGALQSVPKDIEGTNVRIKRALKELNP